MVEKKNLIYTTFQKFVKKSSVYSSSSVLHVQEVNELI